jgi:hypothetical protein
VFTVGRYPQRGGLWHSGVAIHGSCRTIRTRRDVRLYSPAIARVTMLGMHCANCGEWVELPPNDELQFVTREDVGTYLIVAQRSTGTRLVHECVLRGERTL